MDNTKTRAPRNRTLILTDEDKAVYAENLIALHKKVSINEVIGKTINQNIHDAVAMLPSECVDLLVVDPPYNMNKAFNGRQFTKKSLDAYEEWLDVWINGLIHTLKKTASVYICGDWQSSSAIHRVAQNYFNVRRDLCINQSRDKNFLTFR